MGNREWGIACLLLTRIAGAVSTVLPAPRPDRARGALLLSDSPLPIPHSRL